jgi:hypothetical protein
MAVATSTLLIAGGLIAAGGLGLAAGSLMSKDKSGGGYQMPQAPAAPSFDAAGEKARLAAEERRRAMSRSKSVNTNPLGIAEDATVAKSKLLGG